jgi:multidrug efflux pump subunit AcrB
MDRQIKGLRDKFYKPYLNFSLNNKLFTFSIPIVIFAICIAMLMGGQVKMTFFPYIDTDDIQITVTMPVGTTEIETKRVLDKIETAAISVNARLKSERSDENNVILSYTKKTGPKGNNGTLSLNLLDGETRNLASADIATDIRRETGDILDVESITFGQPSLFGDAISISFVSDEIVDIRDASSMLTSYLNDQSSLKDVHSSDQQTDNDLTINLKPNAKALGFSLREITQQLRDGYLGVEAQSLQIGQEEVKVYVRYTDAETNSIENLKSIRIKKGGNEYPISELVWFDRASSTMAINHLNGVRRINVKAELVDSKGSVSEALNKVKQEIIVPIQEKYPGMEVVYEGQSESSAETGQSVSGIAPIIMLLAFFMIVLNFRSFKQAMVVLILIPLTFIGIVIGHQIHGEPISVLSFYGIIAVAGVVINDSLVLVSRMNQLLQKGIPFKQAVLDAGVSRFRAIVLTSITTIAGLAPLILESSMQAKFLIPMAISIAYGLGVATFNTLILLPTLLKVMNGGSKWLYWLWEGEHEEDEFFEPAIQEQLSIKHNSE